MIECEKKVMLTYDEYAVISTMVRKGVVLKTQTNYYFDTDKFSMNKKGITCRIREKAGKFTATIKSRNPELPERSIEADVCEKSEFDPQLFKAFGLRYQGEMFTERMIMHEDNTCEVALDRNTYLGCVDYELEIEYGKDGEQKAQAILEGIAHSLKPEKTTENKTFFGRAGKGKSKSERFFARKQDLRCQQCDLF